MHGNMVFSTHYILGTPQQSGGFLVCSVKLEISIYKLKISTFKLEISTFKLRSSIRAIP